MGWKMGYIAAKPLTIDGETRAPGEPVPEAADWPNIQAYINRGEIVGFPDPPEGSVAAKTVAVVDEDEDANGNGDEGGETPPPGEDAVLAEIETDDGIVKIYRTTSANDLDGYDKAVLESIAETLGIYDGIEGTGSDPNRPLKRDLVEAVGAEIAKSA